MQPSTAPVDLEPIWTGSSEADRARRLALIEAFALADDHGLPRGRYDPDRLMERLAGVSGGRDRGLLEIELTRTFLQFAHDLQSGVLEPGKASSLIKRKAPRRSSEELLTLLSTQPPESVFRMLVPSSPEYTRLMQAKLRLEHRLQHGGWGSVVPTSSLRPGESGNTVVALRNRLVAMGYLRPSLSATYDDRIEAAVRDFQCRSRAGAGRRCRHQHHARDQHRPRRAAAVDHGGDGARALAEPARGQGPAAHPGEPRRLSRADYR
ncbi:peptidoglycan-binding protein [Ponticoccus litoralis]|uniref:Peptidoglycan-binding protein n=1 Tax=Ponticoccus litoralis TaxID=422297 RepID=A0AAW9SFK5_9RHOB